MSGFISKDMLIFIAIAIIGVFVFYRLFTPKKRGRERPDDALLKLVADLKVSSKQNREPEIKWVKFQGDARVFRKRRYKIRGVIADSRCFIIGIRTRMLSFTKLVLVPPELCTFLNTSEISVRARGIQRWNSLLWFLVLAEKDHDKAKHFEAIVHDYLAYAMDNQFRIELRNITFGNYHESASGTEYQDYIRRSERMPVSHEPEPAPGNEEVS